MASTNSGGYGLAVCPASNAIIRRNTRKVSTGVSGVAIEMRTIVASSDSPRDDAVSASQMMPAASVIRKKASARARMAGRLNVIATPAPATAMPAASAD